MTLKSISLTDPIKLISVKNNLDIVSFPEGLQGRAVFSSHFKHIESAMKLIGITVPVGEEKNYPGLKEGQRRIRLLDKEFGIAFYELYYKRTMNPDDFRWEIMKNK